MQRNKGNIVLRITRSHGVTIALVRIISMKIKGYITLACWRHIFFKVRLLCLTIFRGLFYVKYLTKILTAKFHPFVH